MTSTGSAPADDVTRPAATAEADRWKAFIAIAISFVTMVFSMSMVFVALSAIADDFEVTLRAVSWVVIVQSLVISGLMMPMGRLADMIGRRRVHLIGLLLFAAGSFAVAVAPTFGLMIAARAVMSLGNAMGQAVGTAMIVAMFPPEERGKALGSQTSVVAIGAAMGPIGAGLVLQVASWHWLFLMLVPPLLIAYLAGYRYLDEDTVSGRNSGYGAGAPVTTASRYDWGGATLSSLAVTAMVLTVSNPLRLPWASPTMLGGLVLMVALFVAFVLWELRQSAPMLQLRFFSRPAFSMSVSARTLGFVGYTSVTFLMPIFLISVRGMREGLTGTVLFLSSLGMGLAANQAGRNTDRFGERPIFVAGFALNAAAVTGVAFLSAATPLWIVMILLFANGVSLGLWNVPKIGRAHV